MSGRENAAILLEDVERVRRLLQLADENNLSLVEALAYLVPAAEGMLAALEGATGRPWAGPFADAYRSAIGRAKDALAMATAEEGDEEDNPW